MKLSNIYGYGQLFGFSGVDGETDAKDDFIALTLQRPIEIRFELQEPVIMRIPVSDNIKFDAVMSDFIIAEDGGKRIAMVWANATALIGTSEIPIEIAAEKYIRHKQGESEIYQFGAQFVGLSQKGSRFALAYGKDADAVAAKLAQGMQSHAEEILRARIHYYESMPPCSDDKYEKLYYKALSINKVNVYSPAGKIPFRYTTPDRVPHRHMWLWDSVFHAMALAQYNQTLAKEALLAVLSQQKEDGFIPHMMSCAGNEDAMTQPPVLAYGVWIVYTMTGDSDFLHRCAEKLEKYLRWDLKNRDGNRNYLLEWLIEEDENCRSGESGMDNSPRFDEALVLDAVDFSVFFANDARYLAKIYGELGKNDKSEEWREIWKKVSDAINANLWCEEEGIYYDKKMDGTFSKVANITSLLPLFAGIPSKSMAERLVKLLTDEGKFWTEFPLSSLAKDQGAFRQDMWCGSTWLNYNYLLICGLKKYGYSAIAEKLRDKTLECVNRWYQETGTIFEFYDSENKKIPYQLDRKGPCPEMPDWRKKVHSITDYNWSACFTMLMIQKKFYECD